jgi:ubiquinone/menaquinone biosynthesis C-methylase UbiE
MDKILKIDRKLLGMLKSPKSGSGLAEEGEYLISNSGERYHVFEGVPILLTDFRQRDFEKTKKSFSQEWKMFRSGDQTWTWDLKEREKLFTEEMNIISMGELNGKVILDAGCGNGQLTSLISNYTKVIGMDLSQSVFSAEKRKNKITKKPGNLLFIEGNIMNPPLKEDSFDIIYSSGVLHHTPNTFESFKSLIPLMKKHGRYYIYLYRKDRKDETSATYIVYRLREITRHLPLPLVNVLCYVLSPFAKMYADTTTRLGTRLSKKRSIREHRLSLYDHFAPRYAYRHKIGEVKGWFAKFGFKTKVTFEDRNGFGILGTR